METIKAFILSDEDSTLEIMEEESYKKYESLTGDIILEQIKIEFDDIKKFNQFALIFNAMKDLTINKKEVIIKSLQIYTSIYKPKTQENK